jgi:hypothetical protein
MASRMTLANDEVEVVRQWRLILTDLALHGIGAAPQWSRADRD